MDPLRPAFRTMHVTNCARSSPSSEAARADGRGDGFAVVADEIKMLTAETRESAEAISSRTEIIQTDSAETMIHLVPCPAVWM